jgi:hypothetical protein
MERSMEKTEILASQEKEPLPSKIYIANRILERVDKFTYFGFALSCQGEVDISNKTAKYTKPIGIINNVLQLSVVQRHLVASLQNFSSILWYGREVWTIRKHINRITASKMKFMQRSVGCTKWDLRRNGDILDKLKIKQMRLYSELSEAIEGIHEDQQTNCILSDKRTKISLMASEEVGEKCETITGYWP